MKEIRIKVTDEEYDKIESVVGEGDMSVLIKEYLLEYYDLVNSSYGSYGYDVPELKI